MKVTLLSLRRVLDGFILTVLGIVSITIIYRPARLFPRLSNRIPYEGKQGRRFVLSMDFTDDGFHFMASHKERFLSYESPIGSWSDQLLAFQNAVVMAGLLNRTLLAPPLFSELESKRIRKEVRWGLQSDSEVYKRIDLKYTVPISAVIDLGQLSKLLKVTPIKVSHADFLEQYRNHTWYNVCHKNAAGYWLDFIPSPTNSLAWRVLQAQSFTPLKSEFITGIKSSCEEELEMVDNLKSKSPVLRGILNELSAVEEDLIYFKGGSLASGEIRFLSKERTAEVQKWILNFIQFNPLVLEQISQMAESIRRPFNAVIVTPSKNPDVFHNTIHFRLKGMERKRFHSVSNRLYVITPWSDFSKFKLFLDRGYELYSTSEIIPSGINSNVKHDVSKFLGELICTFASLFEGPYDSYLIQQARIHEARQQDELLAEHISVKWAVHTVKRGFKVEWEDATHFQTTKPEKDGLINMFCKLCKTMHPRLRNNTCRPLLNSCRKRRIG